MNNDFRILKENTFKFKDGKLYLMLLRENDKFAIEVVDKSKTFGRKFADNRKEAESLFDITTIKIDSKKTLTEAELEIRNCFNRNDLRETIFLLLLKDKNISQNEIGKMLFELKFTTKARYNYLKGVKKEGAITIYVFFDIKRKKPIGRFSGTRFLNDFDWELLN